MKTIYLKKETTWTIKILVVAAIILMTFHTSGIAQDTATYAKPNWWFGAAVGANFNFYDGSTQKLNSNRTAPVAFHKGNGVGLFLGPVIEYHRPESRWGFMFQAGYDSRRGSFKTVKSPCNCPRDLETNLSYITIEPNLRFAPFKSNLYFFGGPRVAFNITKAFTYEERPNTDFPSSSQNVVEKADFSSVNKVLLSMQIGAGYDIPLSSQKRRTQYVLSPFISFHPYFGQDPRSIETMTVSTLRTGVIFKFGKGKKVQTPVKASSEVIISDSELQFTINSPTNIPSERNVRETFPLRNYIFFNVGSTEIPDRYVLLRKDQVKDFKEDQPDIFKPTVKSGRSERQMGIYYNILNILGDRMSKNPSYTINLVGSSEAGPGDGRMMSESVKKYLVDVFGINPSRITTEGRNKPKIPSEQAGATKELVLLREGDRRVSIESNSPNLLMQYQSGPDAPLKPVEIISLQEAPLDSYISFNAKNGNEAFSSWSLEITDDKGQIQNFGPYTQTQVSIPGKSILGTRPEGDYKVKLIGITQSGKTVTKEANVHMVLWTPPKTVEGIRYSVIFEFNESNVSARYEKYLSEVVVPKVPKGGTIIIHGYTDIIGDVTYNKELSMARTKDVKAILQNSLIKAGRTDVKFETYGFGEDEKLALFENKFPEERFYNRTVVIDIIPAK